MHDDPTSHHGHDEVEQVIDSIVDKFVEQALVDGVPDVEAACARYPEFADRIRQAAASLKLLAVQHSHLDGNSKSLRNQFSSALGRTAQNQIAPTLASSNSLISESDRNFDDKYRLREELGEGGFGVVYVAEQLKPVRRKVAIKVVKPGMDSKEVLARFDAERQALAMMDHPNVAKVLDGGVTDDGRPYFVMELIRGTPITKFCDSQKLSVEHRLEIFRDVCQAVQHAHIKGIIHRDIKPSNVLVTMRDDRPVAKVIDFGVAKALHSQLTDATVYTAFGQMIGTPLYMSPEQIQLSEQDVDTRSDIYSLGVLLYELITGDTPFTRRTLVDKGIHKFRELVCESEPLRPSSRISTLRASDDPTVVDQRRYESRELKRISGELDWIVLKSLEKDRSRRYQSSIDFANDIDRYLAGEPVEACPPTFSYRLNKFTRQNRAILVTASLVVALLALGMATTGWQAYRASEAEALAVTESNQKSEALRDLDEALAKSKAETKAKEQALESESRQRRKSESLAKFLTAIFKAPSEDEQPSNMKAVELLNKSRDELLNDGELNELTKGAMWSALAKSYRNLNFYEDGLQCAKLAMENLQNGDASEIEMAEAKLLLGLANYSANQGRQNAIALVRDALQTFHGELGAGARRTLDAKIELCRILMNADDYGEASDLADDVMSLAAPDSDEYIYSKFCQLRIARRSGNPKRCLELSDELLGHPKLNVLMRVYILDEKVQALSDAGRGSEAVKHGIELNQLVLNEFGESHLYSNTLVSLGNAYMLNGDPGSAAKILLKAWELRKKVLGPSYRQTLDSGAAYGLALKGMGKLKEARKVFEEVLEGSWKHIEETGEGYSFTIFLAGCLASTVPYEQANKVLLDTRDKVYSALGDDSAEAYSIQLRLSKLTWAHQQYADSQKHLQSSFEGAVRSGSAERALASCRELLLRSLLGPDPSEALPWARKLGSLHRKFNTVDGACKKIDKAFVQSVYRISGKNPDECEDFFETDGENETTQLSTDKVTPYDLGISLERQAHVLSRILSNAKDLHFRDPEASLEIAITAREIQLTHGEDSADSLATLGIAQYRTGNFLEASRSFEQALHTEGVTAAPVHLFLAMAHWQLGNREQAADWFIRSHAKSNDPHEGHVVAEAEQLFEQGIKEDPNSLGSHFMNGLLLKQRKQYREAAAELRRAIELNPSGPRPYIELAMISKYFLPSKEEDESETIELLEKAIERDPGFFAAHGQLSRSLANARNPNLRDPNAALRHAEKTLKLRSKPNAYALATLGMAQYRAGRYAGAIKSLEEAQQANGNPFAPIELFLAMSHWRLDHRNEARDYLNQAFEQRIDSYFEHVGKEAKQIIEGTKSN